MPAGLVVGALGCLVPSVALLAALAGIAAGLALLVVGMASLGRPAWIPLAFVAGLVCIGVPKVLSVRSSSRR